MSCSTNASRFARGDALLDPSVQSRLLDALDQTSVVPPPARQGQLPDGLTTRQAKILGLIAAGMSNREIAAALHVSETTVKAHINHIFAKTGVRDRAQAVTYAYRTGLAR
jgi:DNA-binding NarL/FixJ family response regulator